MDELHQHKTALGTSENNRGSKHEKQHGITHRMIRRTDLNNVGSTDETEPATEKSEHRLIRRRE